MRFHLKILQSTLRNKDDVSMAEQTGASRTEGFAGSVGKYSLRSNDTQQVALEHKYRALKNVALTKNNANLLAELA